MSVVIQTLVQKFAFSSVCIRWWSNDFLSRRLRPIPPPRSGNLLCCGRGCCLLHTHPGCRASSAKALFLFMCFVFVANKLPKLSLNWLSIKRKGSWKSPRSFVRRPWCPKGLQDETKYQVSTFSPFLSEPFLIYFPREVLMAVLADDVNS